jgi:hypothetical protein
VERGALPHLDWRFKPRDPSFRQGREGQAQPEGQRRPWRHIRLPSADAIPLKHDRQARTACGLLRMRASVELGGFDHHNRDAWGVNSYTAGQLQITADLKHRR